MMEGISNEACSLAGHWGLGKLIALYDDNNISIDGHTDISFTEDVSKRFEALGWHVQHVKDGNTDFDGLRGAIAQAKAVTDKPSLIKVSTLIGYGSPNKADSHDVHGAPLGADETAATRANLKVCAVFFVYLPRVRARAAVARAAFFRQRLPSDFSRPTTAATHAPHPN